MSATPPSGVCRHCRRELALDDHGRLPVHLAPRRIGPGGHAPRRCPGSSRLPATPTR